MKIRIERNDGTISSSTTILDEDQQDNLSQEFANQIAGEFFSRVFGKRITARSVGPNSDARQPYQTESQARAAAQENGWTETNRTSPGGRGKFYEDKKGNLGRGKNLIELVEQD